MSHAPSWKAAQTADEPLASDGNDQLLLNLANVNFKPVPGEEPTPAPKAERVPIDLNAERQEFESLLAMIAEHKDAGTVITAMSADEFMTGLDEPPIPTATNSIEENQQ